MIKASSSVSFVEPSSLRAWFAVSISERSVASRDWMARFCFWRAMISGSEEWNGLGVESLGLRIGLRAIGIGVIGKDEFGSGDGSDCIGVAGISVFEMGVEGWMSVAAVGRRMGDLNGLDKVTAVSMRRRLVA